MPPKTKIGAKTDVKTKVALSVGMVAAVLVGAFFLNTALNGLVPLLNGRTICNSSYKLGDVNKDGVVNGADYIWVIRTASNPTYYFSTYPCADLNNTGKVDAGDVQSVINALLKKPGFTGYWPLVVTTTPVQIMTSCVDSDWNSQESTYVNEQNSSFIQGVTTGLDSYGKKTSSTDYCSNVNIWPNSYPTSSGQYIVEFNCQNNTVSQTIMNCNSGCMNGACNKINLCNSTYKLGDVNKDALINAQDNQLVTNIYFGRAVLRDYPCADLNNDNKINATDLQLMSICARGGSSCVGKYWPAQ